MKILGKPVLIGFAVFISYLGDYKPILELLEYENRNN